ncbi:MAG TPA: cytochrome c [Candidatus Acidoferrum sp.]|jgi:mono/diheme cytochrome c family protein
MRPKLLAIAFLLSSIFIALLLSGCQKTAAVVKPDQAFGTYDTEADWNDGTKLINLGYQESQGKRVFYQYCVWCHADATPAGPSNRSNLTPVPPAMNEGDKLNGESDEYLQNIITLGGSALGKSAMMPQYGKTLSAGEIKAVISFTRSIAQPAYQKPGRPGSQYTGKQ